MSLVGSLEDLGLGDILQIIHLSRKSGVLLLRCENGEGHVLFRQGLICAAFVKGGPTALREVLAGRGLVASDALDAAHADAHARGVGLRQVLLDRELADADAIDGACRANVESAVITMFEWSTGEFSFEVRDLEEDASEDLFVSPGLNPQFLALEGTRQLDESGLDDEPVFDGESASYGGDASFAGESSWAGSTPFEAESVTFAGEPATAAGEDAAIVEPEPLPVSDAVDAEEAAVIDAVPEAVDALAVVAEQPAESASAASGPAPPGPSAAPSGPPPPVVAIDPSLPVLEWIKHTLAESHPRVHIFQTSELGISRIRQYLARRELPLVLIATEAPGDPMSGARDSAEIVSRLRAQAPRMPIVVTRLRGHEGPAGAIETPTLTDLADERAVAVRQQLGQALCDAVSVRPEGPAPARAAEDPVEALREVSARIRDPQSQGEVLPQVLAFAARHFVRVAIFMVREGQAMGLAQIGLDRAAGPDDAALRDVRLPTADVAWFERVMAARCAVRGPATSDGDRRLATQLGDATPPEAYVAPIESGGEVVALLYADNLPDADPLGDTRALEVVLDQAGLALDRAVLERALEESQA